MKHYETIDYYGKYWNLPIIAFNKIDGSNLRFEYSPKRGFYKFGTKNMIIDKKSEPFGFAIDLFLNKYSNNLTRIFKSKKFSNSLSFVCYAELFCETSKFGQHDFEHGNFDIILFDINQYKKGFISPKQFVEDFKEVGIPDIIYEGNLNKEFVNNVKNDKYNLSEGVVCKGIIPNKKENNLYYCKIKTNKWLED
jgi:hypothetical protein